MAFEFTIQGPAVALRAAKKNATRYQAWVKQVASSARTASSSGDSLLTAPLEVRITNFYTKEPPDVDNIVKPILDGMKGVVFDDDFSVYRVVSQKVEISNPLFDIDTSEIAEHALSKWTEVIHVLVDQLI